MFLLMCTRWWCCAWGNPLVHLVIGQGVVGAYVSIMFLKLIPILAFKNRLL